MTTSQAHGSPLWRAACACGLALALLLTLAGGRAGAASKAKQDKRQIIREGEIVSIRVLGDPRLTGNYVVQTDGKIYFDPAYAALADGLQAVGKTAPALRDELVRLVGQYIKNPAITVERQPLPAEAAAEPLGAEPQEVVGIFGEVSDAGGITTKLLPWRKGMTALDAVMYLGTASANANWARVRLIRGEEIQPLDLSEVVSGRSLVHNLTLKGGDKLFVPAIRPKATMKAMAMGSVNRQGAFTLEQGARVLDLLLAAGGSTGRAAVGKTFLLRVVENEAKVLPVDIKRITKLGDLTQNIPVHEGDVLYVPETGRVNVKDIINSLVDISILRNRASDVADDIQKVIGEAGNQ